jgi:hypothetical protein
MRPILLPCLAFVLAAAAQRNVDQDETPRCGTKNSHLALDGNVSVDLPLSKREAFNIDLYMHFMSPDNKQPTARVSHISIQGGPRG